MHIAFSYEPDNIPEKTAAYLRALEENGINPEDIDILNNGKVPRPHYDGILLGGGPSDINPELYGQEVKPEAGVNLRSSRDELEFPMLRTALRDGAPVLGICRGMQVINVALGGTLYQDIAHEIPTGTNHQIDNGLGTTAHSVKITSGSKLHKITGQSTLEVNSRHHQAINHLGEGLLISATASDGVIEAIEGTGEQFLVGVEWHPENLDVPETHALFKAFYEAVQEFKQGKGWE